MKYVDKVLPVDPQTIPLIFEPRQKIATPRAAKHGDPAVDGAELLVRCVSASFPQTMLPTRSELHAGNGEIPSLLERLQTLDRRTPTAVRDAIAQSSARY